MGIKLQPGDYVSTEGMTEGQYHAMCEAFMKSGAKKGEYAQYSTHLCDSWGWSILTKGIFTYDEREPQFNRNFKRKLTIEQILGSTDMTLKEAYKVMQDNCGIEVGDTVKVLRKAEDYENGWDYPWCSKMDKYVGNIFTVKRDEKGKGFKLDGCFIGFDCLPFFVLELVKKDPKLPEPIRISSQYQAMFREDGGIDVGCQTLDFDMIERIYLAAKEVKDNG